MTTPSATQPITAERGLYWMPDLGPKRGGLEMSLCPLASRVDLWDLAGTGAASHTPRAVVHIYFWLER